MRLHVPPCASLSCPPPPPRMAGLAGCWGAENRGLGQRSASRQAWRRSRRLRPSGRTTISSVLGPANTEATRIIRSQCLCLCMRNSDPCSAWSCQLVCHARVPDQVWPCVNRRRSSLIQPTSTQGCCLGAQCGAVWCSGMAPGWRAPAGGLTRVTAESGMRDAAWW